MTPVRVLVADDQPVVRQGLRVILAAAGLEVVGEAADGEEAVALAARRRPDVVLMDVRMPGVDGIEATRRIVAAGDGPAVLVVTTFDLDEHLFAALRAGAAGFVLKHAEPGELVQAVREVAAGHGLVAPELTRRLIARFAALAPDPEDEARVAGLADRERAVLELLAAGWTNAQIGRALHLEESTIKRHVTRVLEHLGARNRAEAVHLAHRGGVRPADRFPR